MPARLRTFLACGVDIGSARRLHRALAPQRRLSADALLRWVDPVSYHVTLRFFGDLTRAEIDRADFAIAPIAAATDAMDCVAGAPRPFPSARWPTVLALPIASNGRLEALAANLNVVFDAAFGAPDKPFKAHLTVARCRRGARYADSGAAFEFPLRFGSIALFESARSEVGARYTVLRKYVLQG